MQISKAKYQTVKEALSIWESEGTITSQEKERLINSMTVTPFDWKKLGKYCSWLTIICFLIAISSIPLISSVLIALELVLKVLGIYLSLDAAYLIMCTVGAIIFYLWSFKRRRSKPQHAYSNEAILLLGIIFTAFAVHFLGIIVDSEYKHFSVFILLSSLIYGIIGIYFNSILTWVFSLLSLGAWLGAETGYLSGWGFYYLGMNYPVRFVLFGLLIIFISSRMKGSSFDFLYSSTLKMGLLYLFIALWILSLFGDCTSTQFSTTELLHWSLLFAVAAGISIFHGLREDNSITRNFGITFLLINLYTKYFECFWDSTHKAIFFGILSVSFWYLGTRAEQIYSLSFLKTLKR